MINVWGMVTRGTKTAGVQGPEHAIDVATALRLYTTGTAALNHEADRLGSIAVGKLADLVAYPADRWPPIPMTWPASPPPSPSSAAGPCTTPAGCSAAANLSPARPGRGRRNCHANPLPGLTLELHQRHQDATPTFPPATKPSDPGVTISDCGQQTTGRAGQDRRDHANHSGDRP